MWRRFLKRSREQEERRRRAVVMLVAEMANEENESTPEQGGSVPGRQVVERGRYEGETRLFRDYFADRPVYGLRYFKRR